jgi:hypothetical protein
MAGVARVRVSAGLLALDLRGGGLELECRDDPELLHQAKGVPLLPVPRQNLICWKNG